MNVNAKCGVRGSWVAVAAAWFLFAVVGARGSVLGTTGAVEFMSGPAQNITADHWESDTQIRAFTEKTAFTLTQDVAVDITVPGTSPGTGTQNLSAGTIAAGTTVDSYFLHFDIVGSRKTENAIELTGTITFDQPVLGIIVLTDSLNASNAMLGVAGVSYDNGSNHGLELNPTGGGGTSDFITLSADGKTVSVDLRDASSSDEVRIITAPSAAIVPTPKPGVLWQLVVALGIAVVVRPRRQRA